MKAYYFGTADNKLRFGDDRIASLGVTHYVPTPICIAKKGLHAGRTPFDAVINTPVRQPNGVILWEVECDGEMHIRGNLICAEYRTYIRVVDARLLLLEQKRTWLSGEEGYFTEKDIDNLHPNYMVDSYTRKIAWSEGNTNWDEIHRHIRDRFNYLALDLLQSKGVSIHAELPKNPDRG